MVSSALLTFRSVRTFSTVIVIGVIVATVVLQGLGVSGTALWQVWLAVIALAIGIPHGALDHLVTVPSFQPARMALFISGYLGVVAVVAWTILTWNVVGFAAVVIMSALHFGVGDAAFIRETARLEGSTKRPTPWALYALPAGMAPVVIPLTSLSADEALVLVNPALVNWHNGTGPVFFWLTLGLVGAGVLWAALRGQWRDVVDLAALVGIALVAPPLVAFSVYFGMWHALRHTARLTLELPQAQLHYANSKPGKAFLAAVIPGLPALVGTMVVAAALTIVGGWDLSADYLWIALVIVWALTVPHMALTARIDYRALAPVATARQ
jgi:beta-carotene 15,15'-dioxygenase